MLTTDPISQGLEDCFDDDGTEDHAFDRDFYKVDFEADRLHDEEEASREGVECEDPNGPFSDMGYECKCCGCPVAASEADDNGGFCVQCA